MDFVGLLKDLLSLLKGEKWPQILYILGIVLAVSTYQYTEPLAHSTVRAIASVLLGLLIIGGIWSGRRIYRYPSKKYVEKLPKGMQWVPTGRAIVERVPGRWAFYCGDCYLNGKGVIPLDRKEQDGPWPCQKCHKAYSRQDLGLNPP